MVTEIYMPKMTDFMETGVIVNWLVKEGEKVNRGQPLLEIETDKATSEVEAPTEGFLKGIHPSAHAGAAVPVGETIAFIVTSMDELVPNHPPLSVGDQTNPTTNIKKSKEQIDMILPHERVIRATPVARRLAKELDIDLALVIGSGPEERISEQDVRTYAKEVTSGTTKTTNKESEFELVSLNNIQRLTGERMLESVLIAPQFALTVGVDMTNALQLYDVLVTKIEDATGDKLSITGILVKATAHALCVYPRANASYSDGNVKLWKQVNIGVAMGTENGLIVPVIHDADRKSLQQITKELAILKEKALELRFTPTELSNSTFTISNLGMYGIDSFNAILNPPEAAILAVGQIINTPVVLPDNSFAVRPILHLTLTIDHRCLDGLQGAKFLSEVKNHLENPVYSVEI